MQQHSRRTFLRRTLLTPATILCAPALLKAARPTEKLSVGVIGCGIRGRFHAAEFTAHPDCHVSYVADADSARAESVADQVAESQGLRPQVERDLRRILDDTSVDCVSIATCNHWHALASIWALQAGKHVYVEKPLSWCIHEGRRVVQAARRYDRVCQVGTQYRSDPTILHAKRFIDDGGIGQVKVARSITYKSRLPIGPVVEGSPPATCDYHLWAGPAPLSPITRKQFHYDWHWFWE
ncbi:MAG: Gfo/Idh/MocA family oxidoreductase, partial [Pirellulales bacterium]